MKPLLIIICVILGHQCLAAEEIDKELSRLAKENNLTPLKAPLKKTRALIKLGANLFSEKEMSGKRDISCMDCHHPTLGSGDRLPFSIGTGGSGFGEGRRQNNAGVTKRHAPHLFNLDYEDIETMFWDGRVSYNNKTQELSTPEKSLNGKKPRRQDIARLLNSSLAAQTIFPLADHLEMRGDAGNELAEAKSNQELWSRIVERLMKTKVTKEHSYINLFRNAYPNVDNIKHFNIGHVGQALAGFIGSQFAAVDTPYDRYLGGDIKAMSRVEKRV